MILYHGSTYEIREPNVSFSKKNLDFGSAFYMTAYRQQAEKWALRKAVRQRRLPILNVYEMTDDWSPYKTLVFEDTNVQWLDFVCSCRNGEPIYLDYDLVQGPVADDVVFKAVDLYRRGIWDAERTLRELRFFAPNTQTAIISQEMIEKTLTFKEAKFLEVEDDGL
ncbi:MAG: DUF3990 domain-containing protein [Victivallales bacterium]|nr:DUF3990 domain-containing protein [Victivallales bacterium]